jgi:hypothetical protein
VIDRGQRIFYGAVALLAAWVGFWGFFVPTAVDWALPWIVPPLHARFLGAMYLSGATFAIGAMLARRWSTIRVIVPMISVWTGSLLLVSLLYLGSFEFTHHQVWIWFAAYVVYPLLAAWIAWRMRSDRRAGDGPEVPRVLRTYLLAQGVVVTAFAAFLLLLPQVAGSVWPWAITPLLTQIYAAPFLSYGFGSLYAARQQALADVRLYLLGTAVFAALVLIASAIHVGLFSSDKAATWLWFGGFALGVLGAGGGFLFQRVGGVAVAGVQGQVDR